jgi:hypothetical protein
MSVPSALMVMIQFGTALRQGLRWNPFGNLVLECKFCAAVWKTSPAWSHRGLATPHTVHRQFSTFLQAVHDSLGNQELTRKVVTRLLHIWPEAVAKQQVPAWRLLQEARSMGMVSRSLVLVAETPSATSRAAA